MTLFYVEIMLAAKQLRLIMAGHDPAFLYDPVADSFMELNGKGIPTPWSTLTWRVFAPIPKGAGLIFPSMAFTTARIQKVVQGQISQSYSSLSCR